MNQTEVFPELINTYFDHLEEALKDQQVTIPLGSIYNYDQTNITDNLATNKVLVHRGR